MSSSEAHEKREVHNEMFPKICLYCKRPSGLYSIHPFCVMVSIAIWWQIFAQSNEVSLNLSQASDCSCQLERERHREIQVCLLQFSFHLKIAMDAHISDITSCCTIPDSLTLLDTQMVLPVNTTQKTADCVCVWRGGGPFVIFLCVLSSIRSPWPDNSSCLQQHKPN